MARKDNQIDDENSLGSKMRRARQAQQMTLTKMAELTELSKGYLSHLENGKARPTFEILEKYENVLKLAKGSLTAGIEAEPEAQAPAREPEHGRQQSTVIDWGGTPPATSPLFCGRDMEIEALLETLRDTRTNVISIVGLGGVGKTTLAREVVEHLADTATFHYISWHSLRTLRSVDELYDQVLQLFPPVASSEQEPLSQRDRFFQALHQAPCLLILDNTESLFDEEAHADQHSALRAAYLEFIRTFAAQNDDGTPIASKLVLTGRVDITEHVHTPQTTYFATVTLTGLKDVAQGQALIRSWNPEQRIPWRGKDDSWQYLITYYAGIPLALLLIAPTIAIDYGGDIDLFVTRYLKSGGAVFGDIRHLLSQHFVKLTPLEQQVMFWLAVESDAVSLDTLAHDFVQPPPRDTLQATLTSLRRRSLIESPMTIGPDTDSVKVQRNFERGQYLLQPVIYGYVISLLVEHAFRDLHLALTTTATAESLPVLTQHALFTAQAEDFVHQNQYRFVLRPLAAQLLAAFAAEQLRTQLAALLERLREGDAHAPTYLAGNLFNLVVFIERFLPTVPLTVREFDFSHLVLRQVNLRVPGHAAQHLNVAHATFIDSVFIETFGAIIAVAYHPKKRVLAAGLATNEIRTWDAVAGTPHSTTFAGHTDWVRAVAFSPDGTLLASGSEDKTVRLWEVSTGHCLATWTAHTDWIWALAFSDDGKRLASASEDGTVCLWDIDRHTLHATLAGHDPVRAVAFTRAGDKLAVGSSTGQVTLWASAAGTPPFAMTAQWDAHADKVASVAFSPDGQTLATTGADRAIHLWDSAHGQWQETFWGHTLAVAAVVFRDNETVISSSVDRTIRVWCRGRAQPVEVQPGFDHQIASAAFSPHGSYLATGTVDRTVRLWDVLFNRSIWTLQGYINWVWSVSFHPTQDRLASSNENQTLRVWDLAAPNRSVEFPREHTNAVWTVAYSPDGQMLASGSEDKTVRLWEVETRECRQILPGHTSWISAVTYSPDGQLLASSSGDHTIRLWEAQSGELLAELRGHTNAVWSVAFSPDSTRLVSGGADRQVILWDVSTPQHPRQLAAGETHTDWVWAVAFHPDGHRLASGGGDKQIILWQVPDSHDSERLQPLTVLRGHADRVRSLAFRGDGLVLVSGGSDRTVRVWHADSGALLQTLRKHTARVRSVAMNQEGSLLASGGEDGVIHLWRKDGATDTYSYASRRTNIDTRPYDGMNIIGVKGLTPAQIKTLHDLGAIEA